MGKDALAYAGWRLGIEMGGKSPEEYRSGEWLDHGRGPCLDGEILGILTPPGSGILQGGHI